MNMNLIGELWYVWHPALILVTLHVIDLQLSCALLRIPGSAELSPVMAYFISSGGGLAPMVKISVACLAGIVLTARGSLGTIWFLILVSLGFVLWNLSLLLIVKFLGVF
jgi:hypothetical protein